VPTRQMDIDAQEDGIEFVLKEELSRSGISALIFSGECDNDMQKKK
jgi:hypothetical protein